MDPNLTPQPHEASKIIWWLIGVISSIAAFFGIKWLNRQETQADGTSEKMIEHISESNKRFENLDLRITKLETGTVTEHYVNGVVGEVTNDFKKDHSNLAENFSARIIESEKRMTDALSICNNALRSEMKIIGDNMKDQNKMIRTIINLLKESRTKKRTGD